MSALIWACTVDKNVNGIDTWQVNLGNLDGNILGTSKHLAGIMHDS